MTSRSGKSQELDPERKALFDAFVRKKYGHRRQLDAYDETRASLAAARDSRDITVLFGPTGVGKTNLITTLNEELTKEFKAQRVIGKQPFLRVTAKPPQHEAFRFPTLFRAIIADEIRPKKRNSDELHEYALEKLRQRDPIAFCVDEAQHVAYAAKGQRLRHFDLIKSIADETSVPMLLVGTYDVLKFGLASDQLARRVHHIPLMPYEPSKEDMPAFLGAVDHFKTCLPISCTLDVGQHAQFFYERSVGCVGLLKPWFQRALRRALLAERSILTLEDLEGTAKEVGKLVRIARAHVAGRAQWDELNGDISELRELMGIPQEEPKKRGGNAHPGQRTLRRDPVGLDADDDDDGDASDDGEAA